MKGRFYRTYNLKVMEMSDKKTKVDCCLTTRGMKQANAKVVDDLTVPDPEPAIGKQIIQEATEEELDVDSQPEHS
jgi:hypothetical protein